MKFKIGIALALCVGFVSVANASKFTIPESFEFLAVDGKDLGSGWVSSLTSIDLAVGEHKIAVEYSDVVPDEAEPLTQRFINSEPLLITLVVEQGKSYRLVPHSSVKTDPYTFAENPRLKIMSGRSVVDADVALLVKRQQGTWSKITQRDNEPREPEVSEMAKVTGSSKPAASTIDSIGATPAASMLVYWWNQADQATRESFLQQVNQ